VCHHGGAGTTATGTPPLFLPSQQLINTLTGLIAGKPTIVVPFFGDQPFWGKCVNRGGCGPEPIPIKDLNVDNLTAALEFCKSEYVAENAVKMGTSISLFRHQLVLTLLCKLGKLILEEDGIGDALKFFYKTLPLNARGMHSFPDPTN